MGVIKNYFFVYEGCVFFEIVLLCHFLKATGNDVSICSADGNSVTCFEGFKVSADCSVDEINVSEVNTFVVTGGETDDTEKLTYVLKQVSKNGKLVGAVCGGVKALEKCGVIYGIKTAYTENVNVCIDSNFVTAKPNAYVDFALEFSKQMNIFKDEADLEETIKFYKLFQEV